MAKYYYHNAEHYSCRRSQKLSTFWVIVIVLTILTLAVYNLVWAVSGQPSPIPDQSEPIIAEIDNDR